MTLHLLQTRKMNTHPSGKTNSSDLTEPMEKEGGTAISLLQREEERREKQQNHVSTTTTTICFLGT
jgi:hypothetical protein